jgi:hypothetical protein
MFLDLLKKAAKDAFKVIREASTHAGNPDEGL